MLANTKDCDRRVYAGLRRGGGTNKISNEILGQNFEMEF